MEGCQSHGFATSSQRQNRIGKLEGYEIGSQTRETRSSSLKPESPRASSPPPLQTNRPFVSDSEHPPRPTNPHVGPPSQRLAFATTTDGGLRSIISLSILCRVRGVKSVWSDRIGFFSFWTVMGRFCLSAANFVLATAHF